MLRRFVPRALYLLLCLVIGAAVLVTKSAIPAVHADDNNGPIFEDNFNPPNPEWKQVQGNWNFANGVYTASNANVTQIASGDYAYIPNIVGNGILETIVTLTDTKNTDSRVGLIAHIVTPGADDKKWAFILHGGQLALLQEHVSWVKSIPFTYSDGNTYHMKMSVSGNRVMGKVWLDGNPEPAGWMIAGDFNGNANAGGTAIGLYAGLADVQFHSLTVYPAPPSPVIQPAEPNNVFASDEPALFHTSLKDQSGKGGAYVLSYKAVDDTGLAVDAGSVPITVPTGGTGMADMVLHMLRKGHYQVTVDETAANDPVVLGEQSFSMAVIDRWDGKLDASAPVAINGPGDLLGKSYSQQQVDDMFGMMSKEGIKYSRSEIRWDRVEPSPGVFNWGNMDGVVKSAHDHGIYLLGLLDYWGNYADPFGSSPKMDFQTAVQTFTQYAWDVVARYKPGGDFAKEQGWTDGYGISAWEIWNEPSTSDFWKGSVQQYGQLVQSAGPVIRQLDPGAVVLAYSFRSNSDQTIWDTAGSSAYNGLAPHLYPGPVDPDTAHFYEQMQNRRQFLTQNGAAGDAVWVTETGWDTYGGVSELQQAEYQVRATLEMLAGGADKTFLFTFNWGTEPPGWSSVHPDLTPKTSFAAVAAMANRITGYRPVGELTMGSAIRAFSFSNSQNALVAVWSPGLIGDLSINTGSQNVTAYDMMNNAIGSSVNGKLDVAISDSPVYIVASGGRTDELAQAVQNGTISGIDPLSVSIAKLTDLPWNLPPIQVTLQNQTNKLEQGQLTFVLPTGWTAADSIVSYGPLQPGEQQTVNLSLTHVTISQDNQYPVTVKATDSENRTVILQDVLSAMASLHLSPKIDGDLQDWAGAFPMYLNSPSQAVGLTNWSQADISAKAYTAWDENSFYFAAEVTDNVFTQPYQDANIWQGDSIQLYFDPLDDKTKGRGHDDQDFGLALTPAGPEVWSWSGGVTGKVQGAQASIVNDGSGHLIYEAAIPLAAMPALQAVEDHRFGFDMLINDNDGSGRRGWLWLTPGVGNAWDASKFSDFTLVRDKTPPVTAAAMAPVVPDGRNGWFIHSVEVTLSAADDLSGVAKTMYSQDGGQTWQPYASPLFYSSDGKYSLLYRSTDHAGNAEAVQTLSLNLDVTAPKIQVKVADFQDSEDFAPLVSVSDDTSGIAQAATVAEIDGQTISSGAALPLYTLSLGEHEFTVTASDLAGNSTTISTRFKIATSIESLHRLVDRFADGSLIDNSGIAISLQQKLDHADLSAFQNEVQAQTAKHIDASAANVLDRDAQALMSDRR